MSPQELETMSARWLSTILLSESSGSTWRNWPVFQAASPCFFA
jgi:hypothetical protein